MSIEQSPFGKTPNLNNPGLNPNELERDVNVKQKEKKSTPKRAEKIKNSENNENLTPEETKEIFETMEKEIELQNTLEKWIKETDQNLRQKAKRFELKESTIEEIQKNIKKSFKEALGTIKAPELMKKLKENSSKTIDNLKIENGPILKDLLKRLSKKDIFDLLNRKLKGEITLEEGKILDIFSYIEKGEKLGYYDPPSGKIEIYLLNSKDLKEYNATLSHEFTHKALFNLMPKKAKQKMIDLGFIKAFKEVLDKEGKGHAKKEEIPTEKSQYLFFNILLAIDESLAHRAGKYYEGEYEGKLEPKYDAYKSKIHPKIFKEFYSQIDVAATEKSLVEFDHFATHLYIFFVNKWKENLSQEDIKKAVTSTIKEINKFKKK